MILDAQVPTADPGELIIQLTPLIYHIIKRYKDRLDYLPAVDEDDLLQAGRIAIYNCQKKYDPEGGASFVTYAFDKIRSAMARAMGLRSDGSLPQVPKSLDELLNDDTEDTRLDMIPDPSIVPFDESLIEEENRQETAAEVNAALNRLKSERQRDILKRIHFNGETRQNIAEEYGITHQRVSQQEIDAYRKLRADAQLRQYACQVPFIHVGKSRFNTTWTSAVEAAVLWREEHLPKYNDRITDTNERAWTPAQWNAYLKRLRKKMERTKDLAAHVHDPRNVQTSTLTEARS